MKWFDGRRRAADVRCHRGDRCHGGRVVSVGFQRQQELVGFECLGATTEPGALELPDDLPQAVNLNLSLIEGACQIPHHGLKGDRVKRQAVEGNPHIDKIPVFCRFSQEKSVRFTLPSACVARGPVPASPTLPEASTIGLGSTESSPVLRDWPA